MCFDLKIYLLFVLHDSVHLSHVDRVLDFFNRVSLCGIQVSCVPLLHEGEIIGELEVGAEDNIKSIDLIPNNTKAGLRI